MPHSSSPLGDNIRARRRAAGLSQEQLAQDADISVGTVRKLEQGGTARVETLHDIARALGVPTAALFTPDTPQPVVGDEANRQMLAQLRQALMPPVGITEELAPRGEAGDLADLSRRIEDGHVLYHADKYQSVAVKLPALLRGTEATVAMLEGEEQRQALVVRCHALLLTGKYLTQVRQYDMAYQALADSIRIARETGQQLSAATGVIGMCWLLLRQDRFDESQELAVTTAEQVEPPRISSAAPAQLAAWGELSLRIAAAAIRNNAPDEAKEARRMAATAASALDKEHRGYKTHWTTFGPVTAELKAVEDLSIAGDSRGVLSRADQGKLAARALVKFGKPSANNWDRHRLDVAKAHVKLGSTQDAMDELNRLKDESGHWLKHQPMARYVMTDLLKTRKRTLTQEMREMAAHLGVQA